MAFESTIKGLQGIAQAAAQAEPAMSRLASSSNKFFQQLGGERDFFGLFTDQIQGLVAQVIDGTRTLQDFKALVGDTTVEIDGEVQRLADVIDDLVPSIGQVQSEVRRFLKDIKGDQDEIDLILNRLSNAATASVQNIAAIGDAVLRGTADLEDLIGALETLREQGGEGGIGDILGDRLAELLSDAERYGDLP